MWDSVRSGGQTVGETRGMWFGVRGRRKAGRETCGMWFRLRGGRKAGRETCGVRFRLRGSGQISLRPGVHGLSGGLRKDGLPDSERQQSKVDINHNVALKVYIK